MSKPKRTTDMSTSHEQEGEAETSFIAIDYRGNVGAAPGQTRVSHVRMPYFFEWPEDGVPELIIYPGLNVFEREQWALYKSKIKTLADMCEGTARQIREVESLDEYDDQDLMHEETGLIARTVSHKGLDWIRDHAGVRKEAIKAVELRRPYARELPIEPEPYAEFNVIHTGKQTAKPIAPTASMG